jgi:hypothetical protein
VGGSLTVSENGAMVFTLLGVPAMAALIASLICWQIASPAKGGKSTDTADGIVNKTEQKWHVFQFLTARVMRRDYEQGEMATLGTIWHPLWARAGKQ